jgi:hypothetical protein
MLFTNAFNLRLSNRSTILLIVCFVPHWHAGLPTVSTKMTPPIPEPRTLDFLPFVLPNPSRFRQHIQLL